MRVIFHIGMPKTATTFLQDRLFATHPQIRNLGMPAREFDQKRCIRSVLEAERSTFNANLDWLRNQVVPQDGQTLAVLSEERFCLGPHWPGNPDLFASNPNDREEIADRLHQIAPDAHILITVRDQLSLIESFYLQQRKVSLYNKAFEPWLEECWDNLYVLSPFHAFCYDRLTAIYAERFGRERLHVLDFRTFVQDREAFAAQLAAVLGLDKAALGAQLNETTRINARAHGGTLALDHALRKFRSLDVMAGFVPGFVKRPLKALLARTGRTQRADYPPAWRKRLEEFYQEGNAVFEREYGIRF